MRALTTSSSARRRACSTRQFHCSRVSAESGKSSGCWLKQHTDDAMSNQATVRDEVQTVVQARVSFKPVESILSFIADAKARQWKIGAVEPHVLRIASIRHICCDGRTHLRH
jgi:hypothetical protein